MLIKWSLYYPATVHFVHNSFIIRKFSFNLGKSKNANDISQFIYGILMKCQRNGLHKISMPKRNQPKKNKYVGICAPTRADRSLIPMNPLCNTASLLLPSIYIVTRKTIFNFCSEGQCVDGFFLLLRLILQFSCKSTLVLPQPHNDT